MRLSYMSLAAKLLFITVITAGTVSNALAFVSGSNGEDGVLDFTWAVGEEKDAQGCSTVFDPDTPATFDSNTARQPIDLDNDNIFHFTTILIPDGVVVCMHADKLNWAPVYWLAQGDVVIEFRGHLNLDGAIGHSSATQQEGRYSALPGPGGFAGGLGGSGLQLAQDGFGPGAGKAGAIAGGTGGAASHSTVGAVGHGTAGELYGSPFLTPMIGGSGGAGGGDGTNPQTVTYGGGGAGGGAITIASTTSIRLFGWITAKGGNGQNRGGAASGGSVRLLATTFIGAYSGCCTYSGYIDVRSVGNGGAGRVRIESNSNTYTGLYYPDAIASIRTGALLDNTLFNPVQPELPGWPSIHVTRITQPAPLPVIELPTKPTGGFVMPDASILADPAIAIPVELRTRNIPITATLDFSIVSPDFGVLRPESPPTRISGTEADSLWSVDMKFPAGFSRGYVQATWTQ